MRKNTNNEDRFKSIKDKIHHFFQESKYNEALQELEQFKVSTPEPLSDLELAQIDHLTAWTYYHQNSYPKAKNLAIKAFEILKETNRNYEVAEIQRLLGILYKEMGGFKKARAFLEDSLSTSRRIGRDEMIMSALNDLGRVCLVSSKWAQAVECFVTALEYAEKICDESWIALISGNLGSLYCLSSNLPESEKFLKESLKGWEKLNSVQDIAAYSTTLGWVYRVRRDWNRATEILNKAKDLSEAGKYPYESALSYHGLGDLYFDQQNYALAQEYYLKALQIGEEIAPNGEVINQVCRRLGELYVAMEKPEEALPYCARALEVSLKLEDRLEEGCTYRAYGLVYEKIENEIKAKEYFLKAIETLKDLGERCETGKTYLKAARFLAKSKNLEDRKLAYDYLLEAKKLFVALGVPYWVGQVHLALSRWKLTNGQAEEALVDLDQAEALFAGAQETEGLAEAFTLRAELEKTWLTSSLSTLQELRTLEDPRFKDSSLDDLLNLTLDKVGAERGFLALRRNGLFKPYVFQELSWKEVSRIISGLDLNSLKLDAVLFSTKVSTDPRFSGLNLNGVQSLLLVSLGIDNQIEGLLYLDQKAGPFRPQNLQDFLLYSHLLFLRVVSLRQAELFQENERLKAELEKRSIFPNIITRNSNMLEILKVVEQIKDSCIAVLLEGETGTGKELLARAFHYHSQRKNKRFVALNCAALPETLLESELFGHKRGAYTGAVTDKLGLVELADGGTLFLDEVGGLSPAIQIKLLRFLDSGEFMRLGDTNVRQAEVRVISATNRSLSQKIKEDQFREDLYYRLNGIRIELPPLRKRKEDIPLLVEHFLKGNGAKLSSAVWRLLLDYDWPGNVRELQNVIARTVVLAKDRLIIPKDLGIEKAVGDGIMPLKEMKKQVIIDGITTALKATNGHIGKSARLLGINRRTIERYTKEHKIKT